MPVKNNIVMQQIPVGKRAELPEGRVFLTLNMKNSKYSVKCSSTKNLLTKNRVEKEELKEVVN